MTLPPISTPRDFRYFSLFGEETGECPPEANIDKIVCRQNMLIYIYIYIYIPKTRVSSAQSTQNINFSRREKADSKSEILGNNSSPPATESRDFTKHFERSPPSFSGRRLAPLPTWPLQVRYRIHEFTFLPVLVTNTSSRSPARQWRLFSPTPVQGTPECAHSPRPRAESCRL